jgi:hypothetical protein
MRYLILLLAINANAQTVVTVDPMPPQTDVFNNYVCDDKFCYGPDYDKQGFDGDECDQEELDRAAEEIGAYEITCEELEEM